MSVGCAIPVMLENLGVSTIFGIPGNHTAELYRGLASTGIRHITSRHEQGASFMADGYARVSGEPGVCFLIGGPGLLNAATGIVQAQQDCISMLVITTVSGSTEQNVALHEMPDQALVTKGLCKACFNLTESSAVEETLVSAYEACQSATPGVVIVQILSKLLDQTVSLKHTQLAPQKPQRRSRGLADVVESLQNAKSPLILVGGGTRQAGELPRLAERIDAPVLNTVNGKGVLPISHPLAVGGSPSLPCVKQALAKADLVLALGTQFSETDYDLLMNDPLRFSGRVLHVDTGPAVTIECSEYAHVQRHVEQFVEELLPKLAQCKKRGRWRAQNLRRKVGNEYHYHGEFAKVFAAIQSIADDLVLVGDSTRPTYYAAWMYECEKPRRYFHSVAGFGTLGYAIPAAFGAKTGSDLPVVALIGDGGAQFTLTELATAVDNKINVPIIIWRNQGYEEITNSLEARQVGSSSTQISSPDFRKIAQAYNLRCFTPRTPTGLTRALRQSLKLDRPSLVLVEQRAFIKERSGDWYG